MRTTLQQEQEELARQQEIAEKARQEAERLERERRAEEEKQERIRQAATARQRVDELRRVKLERRALRAANLSPTRLGLYCLREPQSNTRIAIALMLTHQRELNPYARAVSCRVVSCRVVHAWPM
jgi:sensor c-di-GMP phosphodiesterase-like protein